jgi:inosose dehydratase
MAVAAVAGSSAAVGGQKAGPHLACNQYLWLTYFGREKRDFNADLEASFKDVAASGLDGFEPLSSSPQQIDQYIPLLKANGLEMKSLYVNSTLHDPAQLQKSIDQVMATAKSAEKIGTKLIVLNPSPVKWGGSQDKDDAQLRFQAKSLETLGRRLADVGMTLSYHFHAPELRNAAREFHHMLAGTDPQYVTLCLDAHWVFRGAGNSEVAVFDVLKLYGKRITELHLRQSKDGVWTEYFGRGDIDYRALAQYLLDIKVKPLLVLEQAVEGGTPKTMSPVEAHKKSCKYAREVFAAFA